MFNPLRRLKFLPWIALLQTALVTVAIVVALDLVTEQILEFVPVARNLLWRMLNSPIGILLNLLVAVGIGALSVAVLERWFRQVVITDSTLWALVPCLALWILLKSFLPISEALVPGLSIFQIMGFILGIFWKGRSYWR